MYPPLHRELWWYQSSEGMDVQLGRALEREASNVRLNLVPISSKFPVQICLSAGICGVVLGAVGTFVGLV